LTGESVILYRKVDEVIVDVIKVHSKSYEWRSNMRGGNPNINNQFYAKLNMVYGDINEESEWKRFKSNLILFPLYSTDDLKNLFHEGKGILLIGIDQEFKPTKETYNTRQSRIHLFWINYLLSLPVSLQEAALELLDNFINDRNNLVKWLCTLEENVSNISEPEYCKYIVRVINFSRKSAKEAVKNGTNVSQKGKVLNYKEMVRCKINSLINKERGTSLYAMIREMKRPNLPKKENEVK
jgi:hypothetical protein